MRSLGDKISSTIVAQHAKVPCIPWSGEGVDHVEIDADGIVNVSDEVGTCGNLASWLYLASKLSKGEKLKPNGKWINDMMREDAGVRRFLLMSGFCVLTNPPACRNHTAMASQGSSAPSSRSRVKSSSLSCLSRSVQLFLASLSSLPVKSPFLSFLQS